MDKGIIHQGVQTQKVQHSVAQLTASTDALPTAETLTTWDIETLNSFMAAAKKAIAPARKSWILNRVSSLLAGYYVPDISEEAQSIIFSDWVGILADMPEWAITNACQSWQTGDDRRKRPQPGDILAAAKKEIAVHKMAIGRVQWEIQMRSERSELARGGQIGKITEDDAPRYQPLYGKRRDASVTSKIVDSDPPKPVIKQMVNASRPMAVIRDPIEAALNDWALEETNGGRDLTNEEIEAKEAELREALSHD